MHAGGLRVQVHAHACIFGWLLGDCISETTADIPGQETKDLCYKTGAGCTHCKL